MDLCVCDGNDVGRPTFLRLFYFNRPTRDYLEYAIIRIFYFFFVFCICPVYEYDIVIYRVGWNRVDFSALEIVRWRPSLRRAYKGNVYNATLYIYINHTMYIYISEPIWKLKYIPTSFSDAILDLQSIYDIRS